jgi:hypothetical protein
MKGNKGSEIIIKRTIQNINTVYRSLFFCFFTKERQQQEDPTTAETPTTARMLKYHECQPKEKHQQEKGHLKVV